MQGIVNEDCDVTIHYVQKNNIGQVPTLNIVEKGVLVSPSLYLNDLYEEYQSGKADLREMAEQVVETHYENVEARKKMYISTLFQNPEALRKRLFFRLVNYDRNREILEGTPHIKILDMALVYYVFVAMNHEMVGSILS